MDRAPSSVARELKRNSGKQVGYKPAYANERARARRWSGSKLDRDQSLRERVLSQLASGWSPEQVAGRSRQQQTGSIGVETIYRFIYAQIARHNDFSWRNYLPRAKAKRGWRGQRGGSPALHMAERVPVNQRPAAAGDRRSAGHWEADLMAFQRNRQNILMLHERTSRVLLGALLPSKQANVVNTDRFLALIAAYNHTPRKCLDWKTPAEAFSNDLLHFERVSTFPHARE